MATLASIKGMFITLLTLLTTGTSDVIAVPPSADFLYVSVRGAGTITGGTVLVEEASTEDFSGTWSVLSTITALNLTGGAEVIAHINGTFRFVRVRISSNITGGGTISSTFMSN